MLFTLSLLITIYLSNTLDITLQNKDVLLNTTEDLTDLHVQNIY